MHRTGTSAITRVLSLLGADLPGALGPTGADNEPGFWEPLEIVQAHEQLLAAAGSAWDDVSPISDAWLASPEATEYEDQLLELLQRNYGSSAVFVLKDPRICRLIPLWLTVLERFGAEPVFVITVRNPLEVAASLRVRDGISTQKAQVLWLRHVLEAERFSRGHPRSFVSYERLLLDWIPVASKIAKDLGLTWSPMNHTRRVEIDRFLSSAHRHHAISDREVDTGTRVLPSVKRLYGLLTAAAGDSPRQLSDNKLILDGMYRELGEIDVTYGPLLAEERIIARERVAEIERGSRAEHERLRGELSQRERGEIGHREQNRGLTEQNRGLTEQNRGLTERNRGLTEEVSRLTADIEALRQTIEDQGQELAQRQAALADGERETEEEQRRLNAALVTGEEALLVSAEEVQTLARRLSALEQSGAEDQAELAAVQAAFADQLLERDQAAAAREQALNSELAKHELAREHLEAKLAERANEAETVRGRAEQLAARAAQLEGEREEIESTARSLQEATDRSAELEEELRGELAMHAEALSAGGTRTKALTQEVSRLQSQVLELQEQLVAGTQQLADQERDAVAAQRRLQAQLADRDREVATSEANLRAAKAEVVGQQAELSLRAKDLRSVKQDLQLVKAQLQGRLGLRTRAVAARMRMAVGTRLVVLAAAIGRWWRVARWLARKNTRPAARAYFGLRRTGAFDPEFYLANYRDVARSGIDPLLHYIQYGVRDRYDPSASFSTAAYLDAHPELRDTGENPLLHALKAGAPASARALTAGAPVAFEIAGLDDVPGAAASAERPIEPVDLVDPVAPTDRIDPIEPTDRIDVIEPTDRIDPIEPIESAEVVSGAPPGATNGTSGLAALVAIPRGAVVILASEDISARPPELSAQRVWHLPVGADEEESGTDHSVYSAEIEALRAKGASYLVFVGGARLALAQTPEWLDQLNVKYRCLADSGEITLYELAPRRVRPRRDRSYQTPGSAGLDVICLPIIDWNYRFQRPQQLMMQFAQRGHRVFYVATTFHRETLRPAISALAEGVWGVRLPGRPEVNIYTDAASDEILDTAIEGLATLRRNARIGPALVVVDLPFWGPLALECRARWDWKLIYDCMDEHGGFVVAEEGREELRQKIDLQERALLSGSDLVLATSRALSEKATSISQNVLLVPNAADFEHFSTAARGPLPPSLPRPVIGYYGAISSWFDSALVGYAARQHPDWSFVLAGRTTGADLAPIEDLANVHFLGELPYASVPGLLHQFDVACIPFHLIDLTNATNPVKFYEYMSAGKPVVSVELPELEPYDGYYYRVSSQEEFVEQIERALDEDCAELREERVQLGRENTWAGRYHTLESVIRPWYRKAAVIITSFNNPDYLRQCLDSLQERTDYPNYEVIVVDNGSDQSLVDEVAARSEHDQNLRLIAQGKNIGFAGANNVGIAAASDADFIVLLNDDTVVTRGWLGRLIGHLQDDSIGLVGPVTNWAGNEARIDVTYSEDLAGLDEFAARRSEQRRGQVFDLPVLAMYCVAISKTFVDELGRLDERFRIGMFEDDDFAMRVREAGKRVVCAEDVFIHHWGRASFRRMSQAEYDALFEENKRVYEQIWNRRWIPHRERG